MAETYTRRPRQVDTIIVLHPAEVCNAAKQPAVLAAMTEEELRSLLEAVHMQLNSIENNGEQK